MIAHLLLMGALLGGVFCAAPTGQNLGETQSPKITREEVAKSIEEDLEGFALDYYEAMGEDSFKATSIEGRHDVYLPDLKTTATFLDFDGNNGYILVGDDNIIYDLETEGQLEWFNYDKEVVWSTHEGYCFIEDGARVSFQSWARNNYQTMSNDEPDIVGYDLSPYEGTTDGLITSIYSYVYDRYGDDYIMLESGGVPVTAQVKTQMEFSRYLMVSGTVLESEGNCGPAAMHHSIFYSATYSQAAYDEFGHPDFTPTSYSAEFDDPYYNSIMSNHFILDIETVTLNPTYLEILQWCQVHDGYRYDGFDMTKADNCLNYFFQQHHSALRTTYGTMRTFNETVASINSHKYPMISCHDSTYGDHAMTIVGYRIYQRDARIGHLVFPQEKSFLMLCDNASDQFTYMDFQDYYADCYSTTHQVWYTN